MEHTLYNSINKETIRFIKSAGNQNDTYIEIEVTLAPEGGNPIHFHTKLNEHFYAVKGGLGLHFNGKEVVLSEHENFLVEPNNNHRFYNPSETDYITFIVRITPPIESFEWFLKAQFGLVTDYKVFSKLQLPINPLHLFVLLEWGDTRSDTLLYKLGKPFLKLGYWLAQKLGVEKRLKNKYCC